MKKLMITSFIILLTVLSLIWLFHLDYDKYPVRGVDVSSYQGEIDWEVLSQQNIDFAFIKATEGSNFVDQNFNKNFANAYKTKVKVGAYHFFSYDSEAETQANNFIKNVPKLEGTLPPVVDVEFYDKYEKKPHNRTHTAKILKELLLRLEEHYGKKPIIYATEKSYYLYIIGDYKEYPIWMRSTHIKPVLLDFRKWTFWQYSDKEILDGYAGDEKHIDMNVFNGTKKDFLNFVK